MGYLRLLILTGCFRRMPLRRRRGLHDAQWLALSAAPSILFAAIWWSAMTLWDREALEKEVDERSQPNSDFEIVASESIEDKSSALNVEASLKASFQCGLKALPNISDCKISRNQARVTLKYKTTTKYQKLSMNHIGNVKHPYVFESGLATHVVTGILYGAQAFFVFDGEVSEK
ncbi:Neoverrucotoxin subunit beta [Merluccius polli]|uniref:Neoverrucotoxin subunit beta n=1 Tax=Merluccius polli TaxID=89951 RepID=A0AA47N6C7_MERPO|nr:Neoverrucotoxin subunit beta [Merluccius polli]KAK0152426.1 Neoverrucotoxin subunit beta [Merluccius polli]